MQVAEQLKLPIRDSLLISTFYFFYFALVGIYIIFLPKMLLESGYNATQVGIIYASAPFMRFLLPFVFRYYVHLTHRVYTLSLFMTLLATLLFFITIDSFWSYLAVNLLFGASMGIALPFVDVIALQVISKEHYGRVRLWGSIGFMAVALWLGHVLSSPQQVLIYLSSTALVTLMVGYFVIRLDRDTSDGNPKESPKNSNRGFSLMKYWAFWLSIFLLQMSFGAFYNFFTIYETDHGISLETTSYLWSFGVLCEIVLFYYQAPLFKNNLLSLLKFTIGSTILRWSLLYLFPTSLTVAYLSQSLHAFSFALYYTAVLAYVYSLYTQKKLAQQFLLGLSFGLGASVGAAVAGKIYDYDSTLLFGFEAIVALLSLLFMYVHESRRNGINNAVG